MVNAFWLDHDLERAARWLVDTHVSSSIFECAMVLTTAVQLRGYPRDDDLYYGFTDNPLTRWAADSLENWQYLRDYTAAAHAEWQYRWDHSADDQHASWVTVQTLDATTLNNLEWPATGRTDPPQLSGDWTAPDYVDAYRFYYANEKRHLFQWSKDRSEPPWVDAYTLEPGDL